MNGKNYDLVIAGGGIAGAATATAMARAGANVLVLEKERVFKDRVRGEFLAPWGLKDLEGLGLLEAFLEAGAIALPALAGRSLKPRPVQTPDGDPPLSFSHTAVQERLLEGARQAGAEVIRGARVTGVSGRGLARVQFATPDGSGEVSARLAVGADGRSSLVRKALGRPESLHRSERVLAGVRLSDVPADPSFGYFIIREEAGSLASLFPQDGGMARAYVFQPGKDASSYAGPGGYTKFMDAMLELGVPEEALRGARPAGPLGAFVADDSYVLRPARDALVLIGDAAGISDPTWGQGIALALHDAASLSEELGRIQDWRAAAQAFARRRDHYYQAIITAESWLTELQLTPGPEADSRREQVYQAWKLDPRRAAGLDLPGRGPALDVSPAARRFVFDEQEAAAAPASQPTPAEEPVRTPAATANAFVAAVRGGNFEAFDGLVSPGARIRALLPTGPAEYTGGSELAAAFARWFGGEGSRVLLTRIGQVEDRLTMSWRFKVRWDGEMFARTVEQHAYAKVANGRIVIMDLLCSGFRPAEHVSAA